MIYRIYSGEDLIYRSGVDEYRLGSPTLSLELGKTGKLTFTIYPDHPCYGKITKLKPIITVTRQQYETAPVTTIFKGRVIEDTTAMNRGKKVSAEGILGFLNDSIVRPLYHDSVLPSVLLSELIDQHNDQVDDDEKFIMGNCTVTTKIGADISSYPTTWECIRSTITSPLSCYLFVRYESDGNYIDLLTENSQSSGQTIEFGKNLSSFSDDVKSDSLVTGIVPIGDTIEDTRRPTRRLTIDYNGHDYLINEDLASKYGRIFKKVEFATQNQSTLLELAQHRMLSIGNPERSFSITAIDLSLIHKDVSSFVLGEMVTLISKPHSIRGTWIISKMTISLANPSADKITLGNSASTLTEQRTDTEVPSSAVVTTYTVTPADGVTWKDGYTLQRTASTVTLYATVSYSGTISSLATQSLGTLPTGCRPYNSVSATSTSGNGVAVSISVGSDGSIRMTNKSSSEMSANDAVLVSMAWRTVQ